MPDARHRPGGFRRLCWNCHNVPPNVFPQQVFVNVATLLARVATFTKGWRDSALTGPLAQYLFSRAEELRWLRSEGRSGWTGLNARLVGVAGAEVAFDGQFFAHLP